MFHFHPESMDVPSPGIYGLQIYREDLGREVYAVVQGRTKHVQFNDGTSGLVPFDTYHARKISWASLDEPPKIRGKKFIQGVFQRGGSVFVRDSVPERRVRSIRIDTGVHGNQEKQFAIRLQLPLDPTDPQKIARLIQPHGSFAMQNVEGVEHILGADHEIVSARHIDGRTQGQYRMVQTELGEMRVFSQRTDTYNTMPGAEILALSCIEKGEGRCIARVIHSETKGEDYRVEWHGRTSPWYRAFLETTFKYAESARQRREARKGAQPSAS
jgi:hypothetical protein